MLCGRGKSDFCSVQPQEDSLETDLSRIHDHFTDGVDRIVSHFLVTSIIQEIDEERNQAVKVLGGEFTEWSKAFRDDTDGHGAL
jgi:hypothetical protein